MSFKGGITRLSELIADKIVGALIQGGIIEGASITATGAVLTDPDISGGSTLDTTHTTPTVDGGTITGSVFKTSETVPGISLQQSGGIGILSFLTAFGVAGGSIQATSGASNSWITMQAPAQSGLRQAVIQLISDPVAPRMVANVSLWGTGLRIYGQGLPGESVTGGTLLKGIAFGQTNDTADANGLVAVEHTLGVIPSAVLITPINRNQLLRVTTGGFSSVTFNVEAVDAKTNSVEVAGTGVSFHWLALA